MALHGAGIGSKLALSKSTTWGTATNVNKANAALDYISEDFGFGAPEIIDDASVSRSWPADPMRGNVNANGSITMYLRYQSQEFILASALGAVSSVSVAATGVRAHRYVYTADHYGVNATVAIDRGVSVHEYPSAKVSGFTISGTNGQPTQFVARFLCNNNTVPATKNTTLSSATFRTSGDQVLWSQHRLAVASKIGGAPSFVADKYEPASYELTYDIALSNHYVMNGSPEMIEPIIDGLPTTTLRLSFPRYATAPAGTPGNFFLSAGKANTALKAILRAVGATYSGTSVQRRFETYFPNLFVSTVTTNVGGPNAIPQEVNLVAKSAASPPTGLPSWIGSGGLAIKLITGALTSPLAG